MARIVYDNSLGTIADNPLSSGATTINFNSAPAWATITGTDYIPLVLEPPAGSSPSANFEVVYVTAYTAAATTATILRGQEGTTAVAHAQNSAWMVAGTGADSTAQSREAVMMSGLNIIAQNYGTAQIGGTSIAVASSRMYAGAVGLLEGETITNVLVAVRVVGVGTAPTHIQTGLISPAGVVLAVSGELGGATPLAGFTSGTGRAIVECALSSPYLVPSSGLYYPFVWASGTWATTQMALGACSTNTAVIEGVAAGPGQQMTGTTSVFLTVGTTIGNFASGLNAIPIWQGVN